VSAGAAGWAIDGSICCGPFLPWAGIWKRCQMFTAEGADGVLPSPVSMVALEKTSTAERKLRLRLA
jgi:hypothetical protein